MAKMPHSRKWQQALSEIYGNQKSRELIFRAKAYYERYRKPLSHQVRKADRITLERRVLPGLSIYKVLLEENDDQEKVLAEVRVLFRVAFFTTLLRGIRILNYLPSPYLVIRPVLRVMTRTENMADVQEIIEDSQACFAINVYRCLILNTLAEHNAAELTVLYCEMDDWLTEAIPKIGWERTKTLGRGDNCCDFRWCRV